MAFVHGKTNYVSFNGTDISAFCNDTKREREADVHDLTTYHPTRKGKVHGGGLLSGKFTLSGKYDDTVTGPQAVIEPQLGETVVLVLRPEGTGSGKIQHTMDVVVGKYDETIPVADYIMWSVELTTSGDPVTINQT